MKLMYQLFVLIVYGSNLLVRLITFDLIAQLILHLAPGHAITYVIVGYFYGCAITNLVKLNVQALDELAD